jgi:hypothetical protein
LHISNQEARVNNKHNISPKMSAHMNKRTGVQPLPAFDYSHSEIAQFRNASIEANIKEVKRKNLLQHRFLL